MLLVVLLLLGPLCAQAASNAECSPACQLPPMTCNYIDYSVYTPGLDLQGTETNVSQIMSIAEGVKSISMACYESIQTFICAYYYPSCNNVTGEVIKPCVSMCTTTRANCAFLILSQQLPPEYMEILNCGVTDKNGVPKWEQSNQNCLDFTNTEPICEGSTKDDVNGHCENYSHEQTPHTAQACAPFVANEIFVPNSVSQSFLDSTINSTILWLIQRIYPIMPSGCYKMVLSLLCQTAFPGCTRVNSSDTSSLAVPNYPCQSLCEQTNEQCGDFFGLVNQPLFNCSSTDMFSGKDFAQWPAGPSYTLTSGGGQEITTECKKDVIGGLQLFSPPPIKECPFPMAKKPNPGEKDSPCWIPCPDPTYTPKQWDDLIFIGQFFASISFILMFFLVATSILESNKRKFPANILLFELASGGMISIAFFINGTNPKEEVWCVDDVTYSSAANNSACGAQGFIFMLFTLCTLTWWLVLSFNMFIAVVLGFSKELKKFEKYYHMFAWGIPLIFTIAVAAKKGFGYSPPASWCFIVSGIKVAGETVNVNGLDFKLFYFPILVGIIIALMMLIAVFVKIVLVTNKTRNITSPGSKSNVAFEAQKRIMTLVLVLVIIFALVFEWRMALNASVSDNFKEIDFQWGLCKIKQQLNIPDPGYCPGNTPPKVFNYGHTAFLTFLCSSIGIFLFSVFGTDPKIYTFWYYIIKCAFNGRWDSVKLGIKDSSAISMSATTVSRKSGTFTASTTPQTMESNRLNRLSSIRTWQAESVDSAVSLSSATLPPTSSSTQV